MKKTITANVYNTDTKIRIAIPLELYNAPDRAEISTGVRLCGYHAGRRWGIVHAYSIWAQKDGSCEGDIFTAYDLRNAEDYDAYYAIIDEHNSAYYRY